jgi:hypothetical protein
MVVNGPEKVPSWTGLLANATKYEAKFRITRPPYRITL